MFLSAEVFLNICSAYFEVYATCLDNPVPAAKERESYSLVSCSIRIEEENGSQLKKKCQVECFILKGIQHGYLKTISDIRERCFNVFN